MQLPSLFYGVHHQVGREALRIIRHCRSGKDWIACVEEAGFLDTDTTPGLIVLDGPDRKLGSEPHFHIWLLWCRLRNREKRPSSKVLEAVFEQSLTRAWATLGLVAYRNFSWLHPRERFRPFLRAVREYWELYTSVGARYSDGVITDVDIGSLLTSVQYALASLGIPRDALHLPLSLEGLRALIDRVVPADT